MTHMIPHTQFTSRDRIPGLEWCYLICGTFLIGNLIPGPRNLVFADRFFHIGVIGVWFLLGFPIYKITTKSKWRLQRKTILLEDEFSKIRKSTHIFLSYKSESRRPVDRVGSINWRLHWGQIQNLWFHKRIKLELELCILKHMSL